MSYIIQTSIKPLCFYLLVIVIAGIMNISVWGTNNHILTPFQVFLLSLIGYFLFGTLVKQEKSLWSNLKKFLIIPVLSLLFYLGHLLPSSGFNVSFVDSFDFLYFISIQPFLYFTGMPANFNHPILFAIVPAFMLFLGMYLKIVIKNIVSHK